VQFLWTALLETDLQTAYPLGVSFMDVAGWTPSANGLVVTNNMSQWRCEQTFYPDSGGTGSPKCWTRTYNTSAGGWTGWAQNMLMVNLNPASFTQATTRGNYPVGQSRLYYTAGSAGSWDFAALAPGEVITYLADDANFFGRQIFTSHAGGTGKPVQWVRTANQTGGWTAWQPILTDPGAWVSWTPAWTTSSGANTPTLGANTTVDCRYIKLGRKADARFEITFGSNVNFGGGGTGDNWDFSIPSAVAAARTTDSIGFLQLQQSNDKILIARARLVTATTFRMSISSGPADGTAIANTGDVDALSPWTWASGNSIKGHLTWETAS
jgi:hypothetical protein